MSFVKILYRTGLLRCFVKKVRPNPYCVFGLKFPNRVGLAAGFDKNGDYIDELFALGFGFVEVGTVTPKPQRGNPKPRLFRIPQARALINRMGFNNKGVDHLVANLQHCKKAGVLGVNIGKNKVTPTEKAIEDYISCLEKVYPYADYITINISSPNTAELRDLQHHTQLDKFLEELVAKRDDLTNMNGACKPLLVKLAPDVDDFQLDRTLDILIKHKIDGIILANTTVSRDGVEGLPQADERGGLSGSPVAAKSCAVIMEVKKYCKESLPIIGVGGITDENSARQKMAAGAELLQIYTGLIYKGPELISLIQHLLSERY